jgi:hypothetical protein
VQVYAVQIYLKPINSLPVKVSASDCEVSKVDLLPKTISRGIECH